MSGDETKRFRFEITPQYSKNEIHDASLKSYIGRFQHFVETTLVTLWHRLSFEIVQLAIWTRRQPAKLLIESSPWWFALSAPLPYAVCPWGKHASNCKTAPFLHAQPTAACGEEERAASRFWPYCCKYVTNAQKKQLARNGMACERLLKVEKKRKDAVALVDLRIVVQVALVFNRSDVCPMCWGRVRNVKPNVRNRKLF